MRMTPADVAQRVRDEIGGQWDRRTSHDLNLRACVLEHPANAVFCSAGPTGEVEVELWVVLEEDAANQAGYVVLYDEERDVFGLGYRDAEGRRIHIGDYGDLWTTLQSM